MLATALHLASIGTVLIRIRRPRSTLLASTVPVSIVRPLCGLENFSEETIRSVFLLSHTRYEVLFCVARANDPVIPLVRRLMQEHPQVPSRLLLGDERVSSNPKLNNAVKGWEAASHPWIVLADSNVLMPSDYLHRLLAAWEADTGLVSSPAVGARPESAWAELETAFLNTYQARWQLFIDSVGVGFAQGKTMLFRKNVIDATGGIRALACELAEDAAATKIVRNIGLHVRVVGRPFEQPLGFRSASEVWQRQVRWARLRRNTFLYYFVPELFAGALLPLVACMGIAVANEWSLTGCALALAILWYGAEALLAAGAGWHLNWSSPAYWILRDLLLPVLWLASWMRNDFKWRDNEMRVASTARQREMSCSATEITWTK